jgi:hypothetical protein
VRGLLAFGVSVGLMLSAAACTSGPNAGSGAGSSAGSSAEPPNPSLGASAVADQVAEQAAKITAADSGSWTIKWSNKGQELADASGSWNKSRPAWQEVTTLDPLQDGNLLRVSLVTVRDAGYLQSGDSLGPCWLRTQTTQTPPELAFVESLADFGGGQSLSSGTADYLSAVAIISDELVGQLGIPQGMSETVPVQATVSGRQLVVTFSVLDLTEVAVDNGFAEPEDVNLAAGEVEIRIQEGPSGYIEAPPFRRVVSLDQKPKIKKRCL